MAQRHHPGFKEHFEAIDEMLNGPTPAPTVNIAPGEAWADAAIADLAAMSPAQRAAFSTLLQHAATADASKPSVVFARADELVAAAGRELVEQSLPKWFALVEKPRNQLIPFAETRYVANPNHLIIKECHPCSSPPGRASQNPQIAQGRCDARQFQKVPNMARAVALSAPLVPRRCKPMVVIACLRRVDAQTTHRAEKLHQPKTSPTAPTILVRRSNSPSPPD